MQKLSLLDRLAGFFSFGSLRPEADATDQSDLGEDPSKQTGPSLVERVRESIRMRQAILLTGPRGCGKTYCVHQGINEAIAEGLVGQKLSLVGNRETSRDYLTEDMFYLDADGNPQQIEAVILRDSDFPEWISVLIRCVRQNPFEPPSIDSPDSSLDKHALKFMRKWWDHLEQFRQLRQNRGLTKSDFAVWPAVRKKGLTELWDALPPSRDGETKSWFSVLFLDEINRFGDGFLDNLLGLVEDRTVTRRGDEYNVPIVVVATANPPGYDPTAKPLSPPLQARIAISLRVAQPTLHTLLDVVLAKDLADLKIKYDTVTVPEETAELAAATTLVLWGIPGDHTQAKAYLPRATQDLLAALKKARPDLRKPMKDLTDVIRFGPDARSVLHWLRDAAGRLFSNQDAGVLTAEVLAQEALPVLAGKVRDNFSEGGEPEKVKIKEDAIRDILKIMLVDGRDDVLLVVQRHLAHARGPTVTHNQLKVIPYPSAMRSGSRRGMEHALLTVLQDLEHLPKPWQRLRRVLWVEIASLHRNAGSDGYGILAAEDIRTAEPSDENMKYVVSSVIHQLVESCKDDSIDEELVSRVERIMRCGTEADRALLTRLLATIQADFEQNGYRETRGRLHLVRQAVGPQ